MAGRRAKPTALKELSGNPGKRPLNRDEPETRAAGLMDCPDDLGEIARKEWNRIVPLLESSGVLKVTDVTALAAYCQCWERWIDAEKNLRKFGAVIKTPKGYPIQNPYLGIANTAIDLMRKMMVEFGMTPSSRAKIHVEKPQTKNALDSILDGDEEHATVN